MNDEPVDEPVEAPETITCVDCGGTCHLMARPYLDEDGSVGFRAGDVVAYRCADCLDRWDVELA
jgi:nitrate/TMAO reductase-like tetraheme cytochrome c subunit